ncbi:Dolichyl-phosphate-mannose-protein mannosyltransferase-domain-containing protein [Pilobolus umbonatus]|nr:Dolichyl-phosphate-mannose-protein mannosyltransferase-domain-containing protein [Pilobolus umbonatus]
MVFSLRSRKVPDKSIDPFIVHKEVDDDEYGKLKKDPKYKRLSWIADINDQLRIALLSSFGLYLRIMKVDYPYYITEAELEVSKHINWYMGGKFFIGKYPPLSSMVYSLLASLLGYFGKDDLVYAGQSFTELPLTAMRRMTALIGVALIPICYITLKTMGHSRATATLAASLIAIENGMITQSRYASPEIFVLLFTGLSILCLSLSYKYSSESSSPSPRAGTMQILTGIFMGCSMSSKWTGALVLPVIWTWVGYDWWGKVTDKDNSMRLVIKKTSLYFLTTVLLPLSVYFAIFQFHLRLIPQAGDHDLLLSTELKYSLRGNVFENSQTDIAYGSQIVIRHTGSAGGYLHSHKKRYTGGTTQQEVTLYPYVDLNNLWVVHKVDEVWNASQPVEYVQNNAKIRLEHFSSSRKLHSHDRRPQMTSRKEYNEVTAYGDKLLNFDNNDNWSLQLLDENNLVNKNENNTWKSVNQKFRLVHNRGCHLMSQQVFYTPPEGHNHQEVSCLGSAAIHASSWIVETSYHKSLEGTELTSIPKMDTLSQIKEIHRMMWNYPARIFSRLEPVSPATVNNEKISLGWLFGKKGSLVWSKLDGHASYVMMNPSIPLSLKIFVPSYLLVTGLNLLLSQRQIKPYFGWADFNGAHSSMQISSIPFFLSAALMHVLLLGILPAFNLSMSDVLSGSYYSVMFVSVVIEAFNSKILRRSLYYGLLVLALMKFSEMSLLSYGGVPFTHQECKDSGLAIDCNSFPLSQQEINEQSMNTTLLTIYLNFGAESQPIQYYRGKESETDENIESIKKSKYTSLSHQYTGTHRYHRVMPTPGMTLEDAYTWQNEVTSAAREREKKAREAELLKKQQAAENGEDEQSDAIVDPDNMIYHHYEKPIEDEHEHILRHHKGIQHDPNNYIVEHKVEVTPEDKEILNQPHVLDEINEQ